jgi:hypothetical protein
MGPRQAHVIVLLAVSVLLAGGLYVGATFASASPRVTSLRIESPHPYSPKAPPGATDDYHCTLINPHVTKNQFIVSSLFEAMSPEVHHEITYEVPPDLAREAELADNHGKGWSCFGDSALQGAGPMGQIDGTPWLTSWAPGRGLDAEPAGTGVPFPAGSLIILEEHYNLLVGNKPVRSVLELNTVPASTRLRPISFQEVAAPPDIPCPAGVTGPLCSRSAELANLGHRFGQSQVTYVDNLERLCHRNPNDPPAGDSTTCTWPFNRAAEVVRLGVHMHLLGQSMTFVLDPGTPRQQTLLDVGDYNFHDQRAYNLAKPVPVGPRDSIKITCTYDPTLEQQLPTLRKVPPHFVTWGDGSTDEMCLGLIMTVPPASVPESVALAGAFSSRV